MFFGEYEHNIDSKGRIIIPAKLREDLGEKFMIMKGLDGCLFVYPMEAWNELASRLVTLPSNQKDVRALQRKILSGAAEAEPDKQGKVLITPKHREHAALVKEVVIVGSGNRVEIWDKQRWTAFDDMDDGMSLEDAAESLDNFAF